MDAYGNFTSLDDFKTGQVVRLISYLDPMICMGFRSDPTTYTWTSTTTSPWDLVVRRLDGSDHDRDDERRWSIIVDETGFPHLCWPPQPDVQLMWDNGYELNLQNVTAEGGYWYSQDWLRFRPEWVDGCWFALNNPASDHVVDVSGSGVSVGNPIISFPWNGGDNQKWRCCLA